MTVKDVLAEAARLIGDEELKTYFTSSSGSSETVKRANALLECYNAILHETAVNYLPVRRTETFDGGKIEYCKLGFSVLAIEGVFGENGEEVGYKTFPTYMVTAAGEVTVVFDIVPEDADFDDEFVYDGTRIGKTAFACGVASEFCLVAGRYTEAENFNKKYRDGVYGAPSKRGKKLIVVKRWGL